MKVKEFEQRIHGAFKRKRPSDEAIQQFVKDFVAGLESGWDIFSLVPKEASPVAFADFMNELQKRSSDFAQQISDKEEAVINSARKLQTSLKKLNDAFKREDMSPFGIAEIGNQDRLTEILEQITEPAKADRYNHKKRGAKPNERKTMVTAFASAMADCILSVKVSPNKEDGPLNRILAECFGYAGVKTPNEVQSFVSKCYNNENVLQWMHLVYRHYGKLSNLSLLLQRTKLDEETKRDLAFEWNLGD